MIMDYFLNSRYGEAQNGLEIIERIKKTKPTNKYCVLSAQDNYTVVLDAIKQYGCFYVQKDEVRLIKYSSLLKILNIKIMLFLKPMNNDII